MKLNIRCLIAPAVAAFFFSASSQTNQAVWFDFDRITSNSSQNLEGQFRLDVTAEGDDVLFKLSNLGPLASTITAIYFDDADGASANLSSISTLSGSSQVDFSAGGSPSNLPGGGSITPKFLTTPGLLATTDAPSPVNGVSPGEWLGLSMNLIASRNLDNVLDAITDGSLRIGIHVQALPDGQSDSFISGRTPHEPEGLPDGGPTVILMAVGMAGLALAARNYKKR